MDIFVKIYLIILISLSFSSCNNNVISSLKKNDDKTLFKWVEGSFILKTINGNYSENWLKQDSVNYFGVGYFIDRNNIDTLFKQSMHLEHTKNETFMFFVVKNQNNNKTVEFKLTKLENKVFTFENAFRDYPSLVIYKILSDTTINVIMTGFKNGEQKKEDFIITKAN